MNLSAPTLADAVDQAARHLQGSLRDRSPRLDAEVLLAHVLGCTRTALYARGPEPLPPEAAERFQELVRRRSLGEPVAHLVGWKEFYGRRFAVSPAVLIPRPETEFLVEAGLEIVRRRAGGAQRSAKLRPDGYRLGVGAVLDLCTGSGAVGLTMALEEPGLEVWATDLSAEALAVAAENVRRHGLEGRVHLAAGDLFAAAPARRRRAAVGRPGTAWSRRFAAVVANPPYVGTERGPAPEEFVARHEPAMALYSGPEGLEVIRRIVAGAPDWLEPGGGLALEVAPWQSEIVEAMLAERGFTSTGLVADLQGLPRVVAGRWEER